MYGVGNDLLGGGRRISAASMPSSLGGPGNFDMVGTVAMCVGSAGKGDKRWAETSLDSSNEVYRIPSGWEVKKVN